MRLCTIAILGGCGFSHGTSVADAAGDVVDAPIDAFEAQVCFGTTSASLFSICYGETRVPSGTLALNAPQTLDTSTGCAPTGTLVMSKGIESCLVAAGRIEISAALTVIGSRPLVLLARRASRS